jgi:6-phosphogluconolactonase (cycloisomerase 2 family)
MLCVAGLSLQWLAADAEAQTPTRFAYTANVTSDSVSIFSVSPANGGLTPTASVPTEDRPSAIVVDQSARFVYVAHPDVDRVSAFRIDASGGLVALGLVTTINPVAIGLEPTGRFVYVANGGPGTISKFRITATGTLTSLGVEDAGLSTVAVAIHPSGRFLYAIDAEAGRVLAYRIDATTGDLTLFNVPLSGEVSPKAVTIEPRGRFLYVLHDLEHVVTVFAINQETGAVAQTQTIDVKNPVAATIERTGRFMYVASPENNAVFGYSISQTNGGLTIVDTEVLTQPAPISITVDPTNRFLYAASIAADRITRLTINAATGAMAEGPSTIGGGRPASVAVAHPAERFVFAHGSPVQNGDQELQVFRIGNADGALTLADDLLLDDVFTSHAVEPTGRFVYVVNQNERTIDAFSVDLPTGQLTNIQTLTLPNPVGGASGPIVEPTGRFLYIACVCNSATTGRVRVFRINGTTGLLTDLGPTGNADNLFALESAVDPSGRFLYFANTSTGDIESFTINQTTGLVTANGITPVGVGITKFSMDPLGRFLHVTTNPGTLFAFRVSAATGALTAAGTVSLSDNATAGATDRTGRFFFATTDNASSGVHSFRINQVSGALEASGNPPAGINGSAQAAALDTTGRFLHVGFNAFVDGISTVTLNPANGAATQTTTVVTPFSATGVNTSSRIR